ncbi:MAG: 3'-5' exonuclease [Simkaniaceae bacterium]
MDGIFLDIETNGLNFLRHVPLEIAFKIIDLKTGVIKCSFESMIAPSIEEWKRSDKESLAINKIRFKALENTKSREVIGEEIALKFNHHQVKRGKSVYICQNPSFDRYFFSLLIDPDLQEKYHWPYHWLDLASMQWALSMRDQNCPWLAGLTKDKIAAFHNLPSEKYPHRAMNGVEHLILCYEKAIGFRAGGAT